MTRAYHRGFSLVELLLVVSLLSLSAAVVFPALQPTQDLRLEGAAGEFADAVRFARSEALRTGEPHGFRIATDPAGIQVYRADTGTTPPTPIYDVYHPVSRKLYDLPLAQLLTGAVLTRSASWNGTCDAPTFVTFDAEGTPRCGVPMSVLLQESTLTLSMSGSSRGVVLSGPVGRVGRVVVVP